MSETSVASGLIAKASRFFGETRAQRLFDELYGGGPERMKPRVTVGIVIANIIALLVHVVSFAMFIGGIVMILYVWPAWMGVIIGAALAIAGWFLLPDLGKLPDDVITREQAPALYALTDEVATALGTKPVDVIALSPDPNASFGRVGRSGTSVLTLGLSLWRILPPKERVALIAHELAHQENGDTRRSFLVGHALTALNGWYHVLSQESPDDLAYAERIGAIFTDALAAIVQGITSLLLRFFWSESQRAEYLADHLGSRVSGTDAFIATNDRLLRLSAYPQALLDATMKTPARNPDYAAIFDRFALLLDEVSPERIDAADARADKHREDATHPPTAWRSDMLYRFACPPKVTLGDATSEAIDKELMPFADRLGLQLVRRWAYYFD